MQKRGQTSPDDGDVLALTFAQPVAPAEVEEADEEEGIRALHGPVATRGGCHEEMWRVHGQSGTAMIEVA